MSAPDRLNAERLRADLGNVRIGCEIFVLEETTSTNDSVFAMVDKPEGIVVFAECQTAGRGQRGNFWESAAHKGLWFSVLLRPQIDLKDSARITDWAANTVAATIGNAAVKPPNDVYINTRKVAGVLVEMRAQKHTQHIAILGVGVNVNQTAEDFSEDVRTRATSLAMISGRPQDRHLLAVRLLRNLDRTYAELFAE